MIVLIKCYNEIAKFKDTKKIKLIGHASRKGSETILGKRRNMEISLSRAKPLKIC